MKRIVHTLLILLTVGCGSDKDPETLAPTPCTEKCPTDPAPNSEHDLIEDDLPYEASFTYIIAPQDRVDLVNCTVARDGLQMEYQVRIPSADQMMTLLKRSTCRVNDFTFDVPGEAKCKLLDNYTESKATCNSGETLTYRLYNRPDLSEWGKTAFRDGAEFHSSRFTSK